jgi:Protein of unknown function (DUF5672)
MKPLPDVTLVAIDDAAHALTQLAIDDTLKQIQPAEVLQWTDRPELAHPEARVLPWSGTSKDAYSRTLWQEVPGEVKTSHFLVIQWDGWVLDGDCWADCFLWYDYIGAPWWWHKDGHNVGNGGFSLRSAKLGRVVADQCDLPTLRKPEDAALCRGPLRRLLEERGFIWSPDWIAHRFSVEHGPKNPAGSFGFHDVRNWTRFLSNDQISARVGLATDYLWAKPEFDQMIQMVANGQVLA